MSAETTTITPRVARSLWAFLREGRVGSTHDADRGHVAGFNVTKHRWSPKRLIALAMMLLIPMVGVLGATTANATPDPEEVMKYSFYKAASSTTAFFSTLQDPSNKIEFKEPWTKILASPGSAGSLLGYADANFSSVGGWLASSLSGSSDAIGYDTLAVEVGEGSRNEDFQGMVDYAHFGATVNAMGLDGTSTGLSLAFMNIASGGVMMLLYIMSGAVDMVFTAFLSVLATLNPFKLFFLGVSAISPTFADGMVGGNSSTGGVFDGLASWIGGWYQTLNSLSWSVMVPLFIGILLFSLLMFKKLDRGGAIKKIVIRIVFIGLGLPLLGSMYTGMINSMADASTEGNAGSTRVVMSTYLDFESWALKNRLAIPDGAIIAWDDKDHQPTGQSQANVRNTALAINNETLGLNMPAIVSANAFDATWSQQVMDGRASENATRTDTFAKTVGMLGRYMGNAQVSSATYETTLKGSLSKSDFYKKDPDSSVQYWFESLLGSASSVNDLDGESDREGVKTLRPTLNPVIAIEAGKGLQANGTSSNRQFTTADGTCFGTGATWISDTNGDPTKCNLAPLAMYNYLNTDFGSTSMTMYSSSNVMSEATRSIHNSVNQVGTGTMGFLYWLNAAILLGSFVLIGLGYAFSMLFASIRRSFQIVTAVPFATLGAIAAIAKVVVYTVALIMEIVVTIAVYKIVQEFLTSLPQIIEMPFSAILNNGAGGALGTFVAFLISGWAFSLVVTLLSIIGVLTFTVMALRLRKTLVKAIEEAVTKLVEKFMETSVGMPGGGKMLPALAGGLAAGAGASAANRMMNGGMGKGPAANAPSGDSKGPAAVGTAGGTSSAIPGPDAGADNQTGEIGVGDGTLELTGGSESGPADGNGDPGSLKSIGATAEADSDEVAMGREVEAKGLSKPGAQGEIRAPQVGADDALSGVSDSMDKSAEGYKEADAKKMAAVTEGAEATGHAALAVGRGVAGDESGAVESAGRAVEHGGAAAAASSEAKQKEADAGRSSLDKPDQKNARKAARARKISGTGRSVANVSGGAKGASASKGASGVTRPEATPKPSAATRPGASVSKPGAATRPGASVSKPGAATRPGASASKVTVNSAPKPVQQRAPKLSAAPKPVQQQAPKVNPSPRPVQQQAPKPSAAPKQVPSSAKVTPKAAPRPVPRPVPKNPRREESTR